MDLLDTIIGLIYLIVELALFIFCLIVVRHRSGKFFAIGFGIEFFSTLMWRIVNFLQLYRKVENIYSILSPIGLFLFLLSTVFFMIGLASISKNTDAK